MFENTDNQNAGLKHYRQLSMSTWINVGETGASNVAPENERDCVMIAGGGEWSNTSSSGSRDQGPDLQHLLRGGLGGRHCSPAQYDC